MIAIICRTVENIKQRASAALTYADALAAACSISDAATDNVAFRWENQEVVLYRSDVVWEHNKLRWIGGLRNGGTVEA